VQTRWVVDKVVSADASIGPGRDAYVIFDGAGKFTGSTGCAPIGGTAIITNERIAISVTGTPTCTDESRRALHTAVLTTLQGDVSYSVDWQSLTLTGPTGVGLRLRPAT
jgi:heat shock protein HslJ